MKISIGYSPCPNDTFIFDALAHQKVDTEGLTFEVVLEDVETLNRWAFEPRLDVTKLSFHALGHLFHQYQLLSAGAALGNNCGPLLIARKILSQEEIIRGPIALPGAFTTAKLLFGLAYPEALNTRQMVFSGIEEKVLNGEVAAGVIIHENRFTYENRGLVKITDLGERWEQQTLHPIPLGGIAVRRHFPEAVKNKINRVVGRSVAFAMDNPKEPMEYVKKHAQEMDPSVMLQHISLYVNDHTKNLGKTGVAAINELYKVAVTKGLIPEIHYSFFLD